MREGGRGRGREGGEEGEKRVRDEGRERGVAASLGDPCDSPAPPLDSAQKSGRASQVCRRSGK